MIGHTLPLTGKIDETVSAPRMQVATLFQAACGPNAPVRIRGARIPPTHGQIAHSLNHAPEGEPPPSASAAASIAALRRRQWGICVSDTRARTSAASAAISWGACRAWRAK